MEQCSTKIRTNYECFSSFIFIDSALNGTIQERTLHTNYLKKNCADSYYNGTINATTLFNFLSLSSTLSHTHNLFTSSSPPSLSSSHTLSSSLILKNYQTEIIPLPLAPFSLSQPFSPYLFPLPALDDSIGHTDNAIIFANTKSHSKSH